MKFKTEQEFCENVTKLILGMLVGEKRQVICIPEVPRHYYSNEHVDMMLLDVKKEEILCIEYKLNNPKGLKFQVRANIIRGLPCIGIVNTNQNSQPIVEGGSIYRLFGYTGKDSQLEQIADYLIYSKYSHWGSIYNAGRMMYYWAFKENQSQFDGGKIGGKRQMFAAVYIQAIQKLHKKYGQLDFMLTHAALGSVYSVPVSKKYYRKAVQKG